MRKLKEGILYNLNAKVNKYQLASNNAKVRVYSPIKIEGMQQLSPKNLDFYLSILQSCKKHIRIRGGPENLKSYVTTNIGQDYQHIITKITEE